jgi:hypothetical protein
MDSKKKTLLRVREQKTRSELTQKPGVSKAEREPQADIQ